MAILASIFANSASDSVLYRSGLPQCLVVRIEDLGELIQLLYRVLNLSRF
jgi:hypothetical protein